MSRKVELGEFSSNDNRPDRRLASSTARAFAAAVSILVVSTLVIDRSTEAIVGLETQAASSSSDAVRLHAESEETSSLTLPLMAPDSLHERCVQIAYTGEMMPTTVSLSAEASSDLTGSVGTEILVGTAPSGSCRDFMAEERIYAGTLASLFDSTSAEALVVGSLASPEETLSLKFLFKQDPAMPSNESPDVRIIWRVKST